MPSRLRVLLIASGLALAVVAIIALAVLPLVAGDANRRLLAADKAMQAYVLHQMVIAGDPIPDRAAFEREARRFDVVLGEGIAASTTNSPERKSLLKQADLINRWRADIVPTFGTREEKGGEGDARRGRLLREFTALNDALAAHASKKRNRFDNRRRVAGLAAGGLLSLLLFGCGTFALVRRLRRNAAQAAENRRELEADRRYRREQEEFTRALQGARTEREAQRMLKRQLERTLDCRTATVLNRNNSANRLEAVTSLRGDSVLSQTVPDAEPDDCLAVRFGQPQQRAAGEVPLLACELCGAVEGSISCVPSLVGGEVIGSVVVESPEPLGETGVRRIGEAVSSAAPVLASMRNLRLAETRAATDALTGLANRRAAEETLKRMLAMAGRSVSHCAVAMFDLDHFKKVNDVYGHEKGDQLLAAVGDVSVAAVRASDFVARFGGEEFLVVLPETGLHGALTACEKLRQAIAEIRIPGTGQSPSASFGVAVYPDDGGDPEVLLREADRALYAAKAAGRNCVKSLRTLEADTVVADDAEMTAEVVKMFANGDGAR